MLIEGNSICGCALCGNNKSFNMPDEIIESVKNEELILFCGAGISTESKNVLPISFYMDILNFLNDKYSLGLTTNISFSELMSTFCNMVPNGYYDFGYSNGFLGLQIFIETSSSELPLMFTYNEHFFDTEDELIDYIMANRVEEIHTYCKK